MVRHRSTSGGSHGCSGLVAPSSLHLSSFPPLLPAPIPSLCSPLPASSRYVRLPATSRFPATSHCPLPAAC
ncbi:hypothetical protein CLOM_g11312 [Closterium sp. NIES-68]|nr:hypothetical protein CLOM_g11312 [Closterium sp. NIES-68]GJP77930.1 hypothetical protein CLOP_g8254 [Closterium sp. NIES-67]